MILGPARWAPPVPRKAFRKIVATYRAVTRPGHRDPSLLTPDPWVSGYRPGWDAFLLFQDPSHYRRPNAVCGKGAGAVLWKDRLPSRIRASGVE